MSLLTIENATFGYGRTPVIENANLEIGEKDFIGLIGFNGSGKTTLLRGILGLIRPQAGTVRRESAIQTSIGYVPQRGRLDDIYPLSVFDIVSMGYHAVQPWYRFGRSQLKERVESSLSSVGMVELKHAPFSELSGGQQQRVLIARALCVQPRLLVLDEPTSGVDPVAEKTIGELLQRLNKEAGLAILLVSHKWRVIRQVATRVFRVHDRQLIGGTADRLMAEEL